MTHHKHHSHSNQHKAGDDAAKDLPVDHASEAEARGEAAASAAQGRHPNADAAGDAASRLDALAKENADLLARLQRVSADYINYQKRIQKDIAHTREFANETLIRSLLAVLDDMDRALEQAQTPDDPLAAGMNLVRDKMLKTLQDFGVSAIDAQGQPFDPDHHAAVMQEATDAVPPNTVVRQLQKGYALKGRTIRPTMVVVSKEAQKPQAQPEQ